MSGFLRGTSWLERAVLAWTAVNAVVMAVRGDWSHASTYGLAASLVLVWSINRQAADEWRDAYDAARRDRDLARKEARYERARRLGRQS